MAWYSDEEYVFRKDCGEKKSVAASSHKQRTHCGKGGRVKFPSDFMSAKERKAMNGECVSYNLGKPMSFEEWKALPEEFKKEYIVKLREKFGAPNTAIADMMGCNRKTLGLYLADLKLNQGQGAHNDAWDEEGFKKWAYPTEEAEEETTETVVEPEVEPIDISIKPISWEAFKALSNEDKSAYLTEIRNIFGATDKAVAEMLGVSNAYYSKALIKYGVETAKSLGGAKRKWDEDRFRRWAFPTMYIGEDKVEKIAEAEVDIPATEPSEPVCEAVEAPVSEETEVSEVREMAPIDEMCDYHGEPKEIENFILPTSAKSSEDIVAVERYSLEPFAPCAVPSNGVLTFNCPADQALTTLRMLLGNASVKLKVEWEVVE